MTMGTPTVSRPARPDARRRAAFTRRFFRFRLPPHWPVRAALGLDVSDVSIQMMELRRVRGGFAVAARSHGTLPPGVVRDGEVLNGPAFEAALRETAARATPRPFRTRNVILSFPESKVSLRNFEFPRSLTEDQVRKSTPFEAEGALPLTLDEVYFDLVFHRSRLASHHVLFAAAPRRIVDAYVAILERAGLRPVAFDVESAALARSIVGFRTEPMLVADIGGRATVVSVIERESVHSAVTLPLAGDALTTAVAAALGLAPEAAEREKCRQGLVGDAALREVLTDGVKPIVAELRRTAEYHEAHTGRAVSYLLLAGGSAQMPGLPEHMASATGLQTFVGDPWGTRRVAVPPDGSLGRSAELAAARGAYATVIGLALRGVAWDPATAGINLLPPPLRAPLVNWRATLAASALALGSAVVALALAGTVLGITLARSYTARQVALDAARVREQIFGARFADAAGAANAAIGELDTLQRFPAGAPDAAALLAQVRGARVSGIRLQRVELRAPPEAEQPVVLRLVGIADRRETFLAFEARLRELTNAKKVLSPISNLNLPANAPFEVTLEFIRP